MVAAGCGSACAGGRRCLPCAARHYTRLAAQCGRCAGYKALRSTVNFNARAWHAFLVAVGPNRGVQWTRAVERCGALCEASDRIHQIEIGRVASWPLTHGQYPARAGQPHEPLRLRLPPVRGNQAAQSVCGLRGGRALPTGRRVGARVVLQSRSLRAHGSPVQCRPWRAAAAW